MIRTVRTIFKHDYLLAFPCHRPSPEDTCAHEKAHKSTNNYRDTQLSQTDANHINSAQYGDQALKHPPLASKYHSENTRSTPSSYKRASPRPPVATTSSPEETPKERSAGDLEDHQPTIKRLRCSTHRTAARSLADLAYLTTASTAALAESTAATAVESTTALAESTAATTSVAMLSIAVLSVALASLLPPQEARVAARATNAKAKNFFIFVSVKLVINLNSS